MKIAIIADIHGNLHALESVLRDSVRLKPDQLIVNGDLVNRGPNNVAVMERISQEDCIVTMGNHEDLMRKWVDRDEDIPRFWFDHPFWKGTAWSAEQLADAGWIDTFRNLPMTHKIDLPGAPTVLISHGSPRHYREGYGWHLTDEHLAEIIQMYPVDILIGSHTHRSMERHWGKHTILNTGAVGTPFNGDARAQYLVLTLIDGEWTWEFRAVEYDHTAALAAFEEMGYLAEGDLSALIFHEELRCARPFYAPYWMWAETQERPMDWPSWHDYRRQFSDRFVLSEDR